MATFSNHNSTGEEELFTSDVAFIETLLRMILYDRNKLFVRTDSRIRLHDASIPH